jgi:antagonist of KipI
MSEARVIRPGLLTTIQDIGRWGYQSRGVPVAGPMDPYSHRAANALVGNPPIAATLEVTLLGPEIVFEEERVIVVTGAEFELRINGRSVPTNVPCIAPAGSSLAFGQRMRGARAYIGVEGGFEAPLVLGSRATHVAVGMGGLGGRALKAGDRLPLGERSSRRPKARPMTPARALPDGHAGVRVMIGPQHQRFRADALDVLQSAPYKLGLRSDRMAFRLEGSPLAHTSDADIISEATPIGSIQVPSSGLPIVLMAERQTTGGYPKIATLISADLGLAGQLAPSDTISFAVCSAQEAMAALIAQERALMAIETREGM